MLAENERIKTKSDLNRFLQTELRNYGVDNNVITKMKAMMGIRESDILVKHIILLRKSEYYLNSGKRIRANLYKFFLRKLQNKYALHIPLNCCGEGLRIMHLGSVLINEKASIGRNCAFHINTAVVAGGGVIGHTCTEGWGCIRNWKCCARRYYCGRECCSWS